MRFISSTGNYWLLSVSWLIAPIVRPDEKEDEIQNNSQFDNSKVYKYNSYYENLGSR